VATKTIEWFVARAIQLYEQEPEGAFAPSGLESACSDRSGGLYSGITLHSNEANALLWDVMPKSCVSDAGLFYLRRLVAK